MQTNSTYQTIPVTKNLSLKIEDIIGELKLDAETADAIAKYAEENLEVRLQVCVKEDTGRKKLALVSFSLCPDVENIRLLAEQWDKKSQELIEKHCLNDEWNDEMSWGKYVTLLACRRELKTILNGK